MNMGTESNKTKPTKEELNWFFDYNKEQGILIWKNHYCRSKINFLGKIYGHNEQCTSGGYYRTGIINGKKYLAHQLIWFLEKDEWAELIDHIDGNGLNNKIENLRHTTKRQNNSNTYRHRNGKLVGCYLDKRRGLWVSKIGYNKKHKFLGYFSTELEAHIRYMKELHRAI